MLITIIAPDFVNDRPAGLVAPGVMILTATRLPLLPTFVISIVTAGLLRHMIG